MKDTPLSLLALIAPLAIAALITAPVLSAQTDWPNLGGDSGGMKYSKLTQITPANVSKLQQAWVQPTHRQEPAEHSEEAEAAAAAE